MQSMQREISYLQGMLVACKTQDSHEYKILRRLLELIDELIQAQDHLQLRQTELEEYIETIDEDLNDLELAIYEDDDTYTIVCPQCGEEATLDEDDLEDDEIDLLCPQCHHSLFPEEEEESPIVDDEG